TLSSAPRFTLHSSSFSFTAPPPPDPSTLSLHDALPIWHRAGRRAARPARGDRHRRGVGRDRPDPVRHSRRLCPARPQGVRRRRRSEEHTSELPSLTKILFRLLLLKKKKHIAPPPQFTTS